MRNTSRLVGAALATALFGLANPALAVVPVVNNDINSYSLFAVDSISFKGGLGAYGHIFSGNVGVNNATPIYQTFSLAFGTSSDAIMGDNTQAVANSVTDGNAHGGDFYDLFANTLSFNFNSQIRDQGPLPWSPPIVASLPPLPFTPGRALTSSASDLTIATGSTTSITPGAYKDVIIHDNSTVTFAAGTYDMRNFQLGKNVKLNLDDSTVFQIDRKFDPNDNDLVGANIGSGYTGGAFFYVGGLDTNDVQSNPSTDVVTNLSHGSEYHMHYYAPDSWLDIGGLQNDLFGTFWALRITGDQGDNVTYVPPGFGGGTPEPASLSLLGIGAANLLIRRRRA